MFEIVFPPEQCCYLIEVYFLNNKSFKEIRRLFEEKFSDHYTVLNLIVSQIVYQFQSKNKITCRKGSGRLSVITPEKKEEVMVVVSVI